MSYPIGFVSFRDYILLKTHFNEPKFFWNRTYNYSKIVVSAFEKRKDKRLFQLFEKKIPDRDERVEMLISALLFNNKSWIGELVIEHQSEEFHKKRISRVSHLESLFQQDCQKLEFWIAETNVKLCNIWLTSGLEPCILLSMSDELDISSETLALFNKYNGFIDEWYPINPLWIERKQRLIKYGMLLMQMNKDFSSIRESYNRLTNEGI